MGQLKIFPQAILARRAIKRDNEAIPQILIKWTNLSDEDSSWEDYQTIASHYPQFILEDKNDFERGRMLEEEIEQRTAEAEERSNEAERSEGIQNTGNGQGALVKWKD
jgi:Chromo (CHRromatin Organisation MOdifier) domain